MNLKIKTPSFELEIQNGDVARVEKALLATFAYLQGGSFTETFEATEAEERPVNSKRNFVEAVEGVKVLNGIPHYQCAYKCTCGHSGKRYIKVGTTITNCHKCNAELQVQTVYEDGGCDEEFNYYVAY